MIVAGVGFRRGVAAEEIVTLVEQALERAALQPESLDRLATIEALASLPAFHEAARRLAATPAEVGQTVLAAVGPEIRTISKRSLTAHGVGSVAEAAALGAAGPGARLVLERITSPAATCAIAQSPEAAQ